MKISKRVFSASAALLALAACTGYHPTPYWSIHTPAFDNLKPGVTTRAEVREQVGTPLSQTTFERKNEEVWEYRYLDGTTIVMLAYVHFDQNGVLKFVEHFLDPAYHGGLSGPDK